MIYGIQHTMSAELWLRSNDTFKELLKENFKIGANLEGYEITDNIEVEEPKFYFKYVENADGPVKCEATDKGAACFINVRAEVK
jgi:hypothetical protein